MRLLWDEDIFGVIGAFCVAALALATTWFLLEGVLELSGAFAGLVSVAIAVTTLEGISRHHYEDRRRPFSSTGRPRADGVGPSMSEVAPTRSADELAAPRRAA